MEMKSLTLNGKKYTSFVDETARASGGSGTGGSADISNPPATQVRSVPVGTVIDSCQSDTKFVPMTLSTATATITHDKEDYIHGTQSIKFTNCIQLDNLNINPAGKQLRIRFKVNSIDYDVANNKYAYLGLYAADSKNFNNFVAFSIFHSALLPTAENGKNKSSIRLGEWHDLIVPLGGVENTDPLATLTTIGTLRFRFLDGNGEANIQSVMLIDAEKPKGIVSFTFDDGLITQYTKAAPILASRGIPATAYIITDLVGVSENSVTEEQLNELKNVYGWDIESHYGYEMDAMTEDEVANAFYETKKWIQERGLGRGDHFAYPGGVHNDTILKVARKYFTTARTIDYSVMNGVKSTSISTPHQLNAVTGVGNNPAGVSVTRIKALIDKVAQYGGWVILVFHSIGDTPTAMFCKESDFIEIADYAVASGVEIKTIADVVR